MRWGKTAEKKTWPKSKKAILRPNTHPLSAGCDIYPDGLVAISNPEVAYMASLVFGLNILS
jgi:hypothetical protein